MKCPLFNPQFLSFYKKDIGMQQSYLNRRDTFKFCRKLMALPFLPANLISTVFEKITDKCDDPSLLALITYMDTQWV